MARRRRRTAESAERTACRQPRNATGFVEGHRESPGAACVPRKQYFSWRLKKGRRARKKTRDDRKPLRDMRLDARGRDAEGFTLPALPIVGVEPGLPEVSAAARGTGRGVSEQRATGGECGALRQQERTSRPWAKSTLAMRSHAG